MDSENVKQIIIAYRTIKNACDAILNPIKINLGDTETAFIMKQGEVDTLEYIQSTCEGIQKVLGKMKYHVEDLKESICDDGEIDESVKMILDIITDNIPPTLKSRAATSHMVKEALGVARRTERALYGGG